MSKSLPSRFGVLAAAGMFLACPGVAQAAQLMIAQAPPPPGQQAPPQQQAPAPQGQPQSPQSAQPEQPSAEEQQQFLEALRELLGPALDRVTAFAPDPDNPDVIRIETSDPSLPRFYANLIEEEAAYTPEQTMEQIRGGFTACRDERPVGRRTQNEVTISGATTVCRTEDNTELQLFVITLHDTSSTQALMLGAPVANGASLIARGQLVFQGLTTGGN
jgi:hypothetical protein